MAIITFARCSRLLGAAPADTPGAGDPVEPSRRALAAGALGLEATARLAGDGQVVLADQGTYRRALRRRSVAETPAAWLAGVGVPRLADLYAGLGAAHELCLEVGDEETGRAVLAEAGRAGALDWLWLRSPDQELLAALRPGAPGVRLVHDVARRAYGDTLERHLADLAAASVDGLALRAAEWSLGLASLVHRFGVLAYGFLAREERHLRNLVAAGVDALSCDDVERLVAIVHGPERSSGADRSPPPQ